jgi:hypothetical protein
VVEAVGFLWVFSQHDGGILYRNAGDTFCLHTLQFLAVRFPHLFDLMGQSFFVSLAVTTNSSLGCLGDSRDYPVTGFQSADSDLFHFFA